MGWECGNPRVHKLVSRGGTEADCRGWWIRYEGDGGHGAGVTVDLVEEESESRVRRPTERQGLVGLLGG